MLYDICITITKYMIQSSNSFIVFSITVFNWFTVLIRTLLYFSCMMGFEEPTRFEMCLPTLNFLVICFTCGMYMHLVFTTSFEMLSVSSLQEFGDTSVLAIWWKPILPMNNYAAISKCKVQHTMKSNLNCVAGARNVLQAHCMLQVMSLDMFIS